MVRTLRTVLALAAHDLRMLSSERGATFARLLLPIAFIFVVGIANDAFQGDQSDQPVMELVDQDGSELSAFFLDYVAERVTGVALCGAGEGTCEQQMQADQRSGGISDGPSGRGVSAAGDGDGYEARLESGLVYVAVVVPSGFGQALSGEGEPAVRMVFGRNDPQEASRLVPVLRSAAQRVSVVVSADDAAARLVEDADRRDEAEAAALERALEVLGEDRIVVTREELELPSRHELVGFQQSVPGMGSMFVMLSVLAGATMLVEERSRWTLQRTLTAPVGYGVFVSGKVLGRFLIGITQYLVAIITGLVIGEVFGIDFGSSPLLMAAVMASFVLAMASVSVLLATIVRREQQASGLTTLLAVTLAPLGGAWWSLDIEIIPEIMRRIARVSPFYWVMDGFRAAVHDLGWAQALPSLGVLLGIALVAGALAIRRLAWTWSR